MTVLRTVRRLLPALALGCVLAAPLAARAAKPASNVQWKHYVMKSGTTGKIERFWVGHRKGLDPDGEYPVVYGLPGLMDDEGHFKRALDPHLGRYDLIAVSCSTGGATWYMDSTAQPWMKWGTFLTRDLRVFVERNYPASKQKGQRGVMGISAGAHGALYHALDAALYGSVSLISGALDLRSYAGGFGLDYWVGPRGPETDDIYKKRSAFYQLTNHTGPIAFTMFLDVGENDGARAHMDALRRVLQQSRIPFKWNLGPNGRHNWAYWSERVPAHLAWHDEVFKAHRLNELLTAAPRDYSDLDLEPATLEPPPLSDAGQAALARPCRSTLLDQQRDMEGLDPAGSPLSATDERYKAVSVNAPLRLRGHKPEKHVVRLEFVVSSPLPTGGTVTCRARVQNGLGRQVFVVPAVARVPEGTPGRKATVRFRLILELKDPDVLRGGMVAALQPYTPDGQPDGDPTVRAAAPGSADTERWPIAAHAKLQCDLTLAGDGALPMAGVHEAKVIPDLVE